MVVPMLTARSMSILALFAASAACGCALSTIDGETTGSSASTIAGGEPAPEEWAVVGLLNGHGACSGTLIAPNLVLTAHHCVADSPPGNVLTQFADNVLPTSCR